MYNIFTLYTGIFIVKLYSMYFYLGYFSKVAGYEMNQEALEGIDLLAEVP